MAALIRSRKDHKSRHCAHLSLLLLLVVVETLWWTESSQGGDVRAVCDLYAWDMALHDIWHDAYESQIVQEIR